MVPNRFSVPLNLGYLRDTGGPPRFRSCSIPFRYLFKTASSVSHRFCMEWFSPVRRLRYSYYKLRLNDDRYRSFRYRRNMYLPRSRISRRSRFSMRAMGLFRFRTSGPHYMDSRAYMPPPWNRRNGGENRFFENPTLLSKPTPGRSVMDKNPLFTAELVLQSGEYRYFKRFTNKALCKILLFIINTFFIRALCKALFGRFCEIIKITPSTDKQKRLLLFREYRYLNRQRWVALEINNSNATHRWY